MKILITIPEEFEEEFQKDRFEDSLHRLISDAHLLAGNYERETAKMLIFAFKNAFSVPDHGRLGDLDALQELVIKRKYDCARASAHGEIFELHKSWGLHEAELMIEAAPTIIPADPAE